MICQHCNKNEANTHIKRNVNGQRSELHLCHECAEALGVSEEFKMPSIGDMFADTFLGNFLGAGVAAMNSLAGVERCKTCGSSFDDIVNSGHLGCSDCYEKFADKLEPSITKLHGKAKHIGKYVSYQNDDTKQDDTQSKLTEIESLKLELKEAIKEQRFEDAAVLRDKINELSEGKNE